MQWSGWKENYPFFWHTTCHICFLLVVSLKTFYRRKLRVLRKSWLSFKRPEIRKLFWQVFLIWLVLWQIFQALAVELSCPGNMRNKARGWQFVIIRNRSGMLSSHLKVSNHHQVLKQISEWRTCKNQLEERTHRWYGRKLRNAAGL